MGDAPRRVNFFHGMLLSAADLADEQAYLRDRRQLHNRLLHGCGVVDGLDVTADGGDALQVTPGLAIDGLGRDIVLTEATRVDASAVVADGHDGRDLLITWTEEASDPVPGPDASPVPSRWIERPRLELARHGEAGEDALVLARVRRGRHGALAVDSSTRRLASPPGCAGEPSD